MIPKVIHYCWFGEGEKSNKMKHCIASWHKYCPDFKIIEWNESNTDLDMNPYVRMCYNEKKFAFLTDYLRLLIIYKYGGIYMDTDVEVLKSLSPLLQNQAYFGFELDDYVNTGMGFGAEAGSKTVELMIQEYDQLLDGKHGTIGCPILNTEALFKAGLDKNGEEQSVLEAKVYPIDYFNPYDDVTGVLSKTKNSYSIHWYAKSWMSKKKQIRSKLTKPLHRVFGKDIFHKG